MYNEMLHFLADLVTLFFVTFGVNVPHPNLCHVLYDWFLRLFCFVFSLKQLNIGVTPLRSISQQQETDTSWAFTEFLMVETKSGVELQSNQSWCQFNQQCFLLTFPKKLHPLAEQKINP